MTDLFEWQPPPLPSPPSTTAFDGMTYDHRFDYTRLDGQLRDVFNVVKDGQWHTLDHIRRIVGGKEQSISARLRDLRKPKYGSHTIERESLGGGLFKYRMVIDAK